MSILKMYNHEEHEGHEVFNLFFFVFSVLFVVNNPFGVS
jgi:hypothetical protein